MDAAFVSTTTVMFILVLKYVMSFNYNSAPSLLNLPEIDWGIPTLL